MRSNLLMLIVIAGVAAGFAAGCKDKNSPPQGKVSSGDAKSEGEICAEHGVPESVCTRCDPSLIPAFKAKGDWCGEHGLPESQCTICNPNLKKAIKKSDDHGHESESGHGDEVKLTAEAVERSGIRIEPVRRQALSETFIAPARVSFNMERMAHVGSPVRGRVAELKARVGDAAKKGDVLLVIDSPELGEAQGDYLQKLTNLETAQPTVEIARSAFERATKLYEESQGISLTEVQKRQAEYKAAQGSLTNAKAAVRASENRLHLLGMDQQAVSKLQETGEINPRYITRAPIDGQVVRREATLGELVGPDREALLVLADMQALWVLADVPESSLAQVQVGCKALIRMAAFGQEAIEGKVSYISSEIDPATRTASVRIEVTNQDRKLRPGMFAQAEIATGTQAKETLALPEEAIQTVEGQPAVFVPVEGEPNTFAKRTVRVAPPVGGMVPILSGLKEGEPVVIAGSFILKADLGKAGAEHEH